MVGKGVLQLRNAYTVTIIDEKTLTFSVNENVEQHKMEPAGQLIVDSDHYAFVYLFDAGEGYTYIRFEQPVWRALVDVLTQEKDPTLQVGEHTFVLQHFFEELNMLVYNIEGNDNYGEVFVQAVEQAFAQILTDAAQ